MVELTKKVWVNLHKKVLWDQPPDVVIGNPGTEFVLFWEFCQICQKCFCGKIL
jgi:hypothetical protein